MTDPDPPAHTPSPDGPDTAGDAGTGHLFVYIDGASSGNPGPCGCAAIITDARGDTILERARAFGPATNNVAEYQGLILGLQAAAELKPTRLTVRSDSELLVRQMAGEYKIRAPHLKPLHRQARDLLRPFKSVEIEHIPRALNKDADALAAKALEKARTVDAGLPPEARKKPRTKTFRLK